MLIPNPKHFFECFIRDELYGGRGQATHEVSAQARVEPAQAVCAIDVPHAIQVAAVCGLTTRAIGLHALAQHISREGDGLGRDVGTHACYRFEGGGHAAVHRVNGHVAFEHLVACHLQPHVWRAAQKSHDVAFV